MTLKSLTCFLFNDLEPSERASIEPILENLSQLVSVETIWVTEAQKRFFKKRGRGDYWIVARDWRGALDFLSANSYKQGRVFVSILNSPHEEKQLYGLSFQAFFGGLPKSTTLIVYSPIQYRFFQDIKKVPKEQLKMGTLAVPHQNFNMPRKVSRDKFQVGTFCDFSAESNINFLLGVAHFVSRQSSQIHFNILGRGPLYSHFLRMVDSLDLKDYVSIVETTSETLVGSLDLFLYAPLRNYHFVPLMIAGACSVPVISVDLPGIQDFIVPGATGVLIPSYEIRAMGEKILSLFKDESLRHSLGSGLNQHVKNTFSSQFLNQRHDEIFFNGALLADTQLRPAA